MTDMILVTGGSGLIGSHFVCDWLAEERSGVTGLDQRTVAGHLATLSGVAGRHSHRFICGNSNDRQRVSRLLHPHPPRQGTFCRGDASTGRFTGRMDFEVFKGGISRRRYSGQHSAPGERP